MPARPSSLTSTISKIFRLPKSACEPSKKAEAEPTRRKRSSANLAWAIGYDALARKDLSRLDNQVARRIVTFMRERVAKLDDPRSIGQTITGPEFGYYWRYRVGDYRIVCEIQDKKVVVLVLRIGHRREVYR